LRGSLWLNQTRYIFEAGFNNSALLREAKVLGARLEASKNGPLITIVSISHYFWPGLIALPKNILPIYISTCAY
jgi:hypothetical protein